jgi:biotin-(acetyl-CoA carboxylase) ligase
LRHVSDQLNVRRASSGLDLPEAVSPEKLLARILQAFEKLYVDFRIHGWGGPLNDLFIKHWLHS